MNTVVAINTAVFILLTVLYFYQFIYVIVALVWDRKHEAIPDDKKYQQHRFAFIIAARNESSVIGNLVKSIKAQNYPAELVDVIVVADNCTDNTAEIARTNGAIVYERFNQELVGKGYALDYVFNKIKEDEGSYRAYDGYFIFDADNVLDRNYVLEMNKTFSEGYPILTSYRNSKNYGTNWITSGYSLWFCREAKYLNNPRMLLNTSCAVSGTGFLINSKIIEKYKGWKCNLLTEDIQFSVVNVLEGEKIGYCGKAMFYDEQPETFKQSWNQRLRWSKGFYQVMYHYGFKLIARGLKNRKLFSSCYDMFMTIAPATLLSIACVVLNIFILALAISDPVALSMILPITLHSVIFTAVSFYVLMFGMGVLTLITEWNKIIASSSSKIASAFTFPLFMITYIPISLVALVKKVEWKPIKHSVTMSMEEIESNKTNNN